VLPESVLVLGGAAGAAVLARPADWNPNRPRVWAARGLLYAWDDRVAPTVLAGLADPAWRVAEMCLKVCARHDLPAGDDAARLARHALPRVRVAALRALGAGGDVEHLPAVRTSLEDDEPQVRAAAARALDRMRARLDLPG
jgi:HEAT repeat protein